MNNYILKLFKISLPIFISTALYVLALSIDLFLVSHYNEKLVGSIGNANQLLFYSNILLDFAIVGSSILLTQYFGGKKQQQFNEITTVSFVLTFSLAISMAIGIHIFAPFLLSSVLNVPTSIQGNAETFLKIVNFSTPFLGISLLYGNIASATGKTWIAMVASILMNIVNFFFVYCVLYGPLASYNLGIEGVALSTTLARIIATIVIVVLVHRFIDIRLSLDATLPLFKKWFKPIALLSLPSVADSVSYNTYQLIITQLINGLGILALTTKLYVQNISMYNLLFSIALARGGAILVGQAIGKNNLKEAKKIGTAAIMLSVILSTFVAILMFLLNKQLLSLFTTNASILKLGAAMILINVALEVGRSLNISAGAMSKAAGEVNAPFIISVIVIWIIILPLILIYSVFGNSLLIIWAFVAADELMRGILILYVWLSNYWKKRAQKMVSKIEEEEESYHYNYD